MKLLSIHHCFIYGPEAESVPAPKNGFVEVGEKYDAFVKKYIRGKKKQKKSY